MTCFYSPSPPQSLTINPCLEKCPDLRAACVFSMRALWKFGKFIIHLVDVARRVSAIRYTSSPKFNVLKWGFLARLHCISCDSFTTGPVSGQGQDSMLGKVFGTAGPPCPTVSCKTLSSRNMALLGFLMLWRSLVRVESNWIEYCFICPVGAFCWCMYII